MSLLALAPLVCALFVAVGTGLYMLKRKALAQAHCVQQASALQNKLRETLDRLLALNSQARSLRAQRSAADQALKAALASLNPIAIASAQAYWNAVVLQQIALRARQQNLLSTADAQRVSAHREMSERVRSLGVTRVSSKRVFPRALAVVPEPALSLTRITKLSLSSKGSNSIVSSLIWICVRLLREVGRI